ncbi:phage antirepressor KilAC domain-containing protein [Nocardia brasiliensis]|uniref:phage antirepressor KilAC domain-containing protein n=1 Tax=Nocardia brasiliensis TaxID=37326 RepID=UPI0024569C33|nr:phage antirepressor KilAC domain-containing protein [Nocardia brasiliensis]
MSAELVPFTYEGATVRTVMIDGEPWFVLADLCAVLDVRNGRDVAARLADDQKGVGQIDTPGGRQQMTIVNESGMYEVVIRSDKPGAVTFRRWITAEVLPAIRKTGGYSSQPALSPAEQMARGLMAAQELLAAKDERIAELEPKAEVADKLLDADGDLSVRDAAQSLTRAGVKTGQQRLFIELARRRWISRAGDGRWRVLQYAIDHGFMSVLPQSHYHPKTGELVMDPPQPRVTPKGLQRLLSDLTKDGAA